MAAPPFHLPALDRSSREVDALSRPRPVARRLVGFVRRAGLPLSLLSGLLLFAVVVESHYPIRTWLFWRYAVTWVLTLFWTAALAAGGDAVVRRLMPALAFRERVVSALAAGLLIFVLGMFVGGLLGLYGPVFFVALPAVMLVGGGHPRGLPRTLLRFARMTMAARRRAPEPLSCWLIRLFGLGGLVMLYFAILTPDNVAADAHWYHLAIAEHYGAQHAIRRFPEGWYQGVLPQLATLVYSWAFLLPWGRLFDRVELAAHLEFMIFVWTLAGVGLLVRWAAGPALRALGARATVHGAWAAYFLFPGIFLYDSSLGVAADHIAAFWAVPLALALRRFWRHPTTRHALWFAVPVSGALLTKYQAVSLVALPVAAFAVRVVVLQWRWRARPAEAATTPRPWIAALACIAAGLTLTAPHWLKNWLWYGDPLYPFLHSYLNATPFSADAAHLFDHFYRSTQVWAPAGTLRDKLRDTLTALVTFSFAPNDWPSFHGRVPVFGSLFTLALLPLLFVRKAARIWTLVLASELGIFLWYWISHQDRYLQALLPWMVAVTAAVMAVVWQAGRSARAALALLVGFQIIWGGDVYFIPTHAMIGAAPAKRTIDLLSSGHRKDVAARDRLYGFVDVAQKLPRDARVLIHDMNDRLGIERPVVTDTVMWQGGINYGRMASPRQMDRALRDMGVTHLLWRAGSTGYDSLAGDLVFLTFANRYADKPETVGGYTIARMPPTPPADVADVADVDVRWLTWSVAVLPCRGGAGYAPGQYRLEDLAVPSVEPRTFPEPQHWVDEPDDAAALASTSDLVAVDPECYPGVTLASPAFIKAGTRHKTELWLRARRNRQN